jgi:hypothetical protein
VLHCLIFHRLLEPVTVFIKSINCDGLLLGPLPGYQTMDIAYPLQVIAELCVDSRSTFSIAQSDIQQFYDWVHPTPLLQMLIDIGVSSTLALATMRLQLLPPVTLCLHAFQVELPSRVRGLLTGSRTAALLSLLPVAGAVCKNTTKLVQLGVPFDEDGFRSCVEDPVSHYETTCAVGVVHSRTIQAVCTIVNCADYLYTISFLPSGATTSMLAIEETLKEDWKLKLKSSSLQSMTFVGEETRCVPLGRFETVSNMNVLGHLLANSASCIPCITSTCVRAWSAFWLQKTRVRKGTPRKAWQKPWRKVLGAPSRSLESLRRCKELAKGGVVLEWPDDLDV